MVVLARVTSFSFFHFSFFNLFAGSFHFSFPPPRLRLIKRLREARVTGVTCASSTLPLLSRTGPRSAGGISGGARKSGLLAGALTGRGGSRGGGQGGGGGRGYDVVILDECSQVVEPLSLLPLAVAQPRRLVLVGDPMQLPPPVAHARVRG